MPLSGNQRAPLAACGAVVEIVDEQALRLGRIQVHSRAIVIVVAAACACLTASVACGSCHVICVLFWCASPATSMSIERIASQDYETCCM
jgi:hypothetical protein